MFIVAMLLMASGYAMTYWGIDNFIVWKAQRAQGVDPLSSEMMDSVPFISLFGLPHKGSLHKVPFPYTQSGTAGNGSTAATPTSNGTGAPNAGTSSPTTITQV
jgi:hypothetical protein